MQVKSPLTLCVRGLMVHKLESDLHTDTHPTYFLHVQMRKISKVLTPMSGVSGHEFLTVLRFCSDHANNVSWVLVLGANAKFCLRCRMLQVESNSRIKGISGYMFRCCTPTHTHTHTHTPPPPGPSLPVAAPRASRRLPPLPRRGTLTAAARSSSTRGPEAPRRDITVNRRVRFTDPRGAWPRSLFGIETHDVAFVTVSRLGES